MAQIWKFGDYAAAFFGCQYLGTVLTSLRSVEADPNAIDFRPGVPERNVLFQVTGPFQHGAGYGPMNIDLTIAYVLQDARISRRLAAFIVVLGQPVNRDCNAATRQAHPLHGNGNNCAGHH